MSLAVLVLGPAGVAGSASAQTAGAAAEVEADPGDAEVSLRLSAGGLPYYVGQINGVGVEVRNAGPATATGVTAIVRLPPGLVLVLPQPGCTTTDAGTVCTYRIGSIPPGAGSASPLLFIPTAPGAYSIQGEVTADQPDPYLGNNADTVEFTVSALADLVVSVTESGDPVVPGRPFTYTSTVTNQGPSPAGEFVLVDEWRANLRGGAELLSVEASENVSCTATSGARVECRAATLGVSEIATVSITLRPLGVGSVSNTATVTSTTEDPDRTDNQASETTTVGPA